MGLLSQLRSLFSAAAASLDQPAEDGSQRITVYDRFGRPLEITRDDWRTQVLPGQLDEARDDAESLYSIIVAALEDGFFREVLPASARLMEIDANRERCHTVRAIALMKTGDLDGAERVLAEYLDRFGPSGTVLTNLAKVQDQRGLADQAEATLWLGLTHDPNQDNGLLWYCSLQQEKSGDDALWEAMRRAAALPKSWRPQLWLARRALEERNLAEAKTHYDHVLKHAADESDVLVMISGDLGKNGYIGEIIDVIAPVYDPHRHNPMAGLNLLQAYLQRGQAAAGEELVHELFALNRPDLRDHLFHFANEFDKLKSTPAAREPAPDEPLEMALAALDRPIWSSGLHDPAWLFPSEKDRRAQVVFIPLANTTPTGQTDPQVQREDDLGRLTRSLALYLAEATYFWTGYKARTVVPVIPRGGPVVTGTAWAEEQVFEFAGDARFAVSGTLARSGERLQVELTLWDCARRASVRRLERTAVADDFGAAVLELERELIAALASPPREKPSEEFYRRPDAAAMNNYLCCLGQSLTLALVARGVTSRDAIWGERNIFQYLLELVIQRPDDQVSKIMFLGALATAHAYGSVIYSEFKQQALHLIEDEQDRQSPLYRLSPLVLKPFDVHRFRQRQHELLATARGSYRDWLESLADA
jgi:tetratricopeptide (TPR) repeat protein